MITNNYANEVNENKNSIDDYTSGDYTSSDYTSGDYTGGDIYIKNETGYMIMIFFVGLGIPVLMILLAILLAYKKQQTIRRHIVSNTNGIA